MDRRSFGACWCLAEVPKLRHLEYCDLGRHSAHRSGSGSTELVFSHGCGAPVVCWRPPIGSVVEAEQRRSFNTCFEVLVPILPYRKKRESFPPSFSSLVRVFASRLHCSESF